MTNSHDARASLGYSSDRRLCCVGCPSTSVVFNERDGGLFLNWRFPKSSLATTALYTTVSWGTVSGSVWCRQTWPKHDDLRRLTVDNTNPPNVRRRHWLTCCRGPYILVCFVFLMWYAKYPPVAFFQRHMNFCSPDQQSKSTSHIRRAVVIR